MSFNGGWTYDSSALKASHTYGSENDKMSFHFYCSQDVTELKIKVQVMREASVSGTTTNIKSFKLSIDDGRTRNTKARTQQNDEKQWKAKTFSDVSGGSHVLNIQPLNQNTLGLTFWAVVMDSTGGTWCSFLEDVADAIDA